MKFYKNWNYVLKTRLLRTKWNLLALIIIGVQTNELGILSIILFSAGYYSQTYYGPKTRMSWKWNFGRKYICSCNNWCVNQRARYMHLVIIQLLVGTLLSLWNVMKVIGMHLSPSLMWVVFSMTSTESQKGLNTVQQCSIENQKGATAIDFIRTIAPLAFRFWYRSSLNSTNTLLALN